MAGRRSHAQAVGLVVLFLLSSWLNAVAPATTAPAVLADESVVRNAGAGEQVNLTLTTTPNSALTLDL
ncbi:MAG: hypothetical protein VX068_00020, partial [Candidatus Thermoplasmatota archaeon]|nr:hypothetical protein [Candidatus Thermoplasmatota archaeon]